MNTRKWICSLCVLLLLSISLTGWGQSLVSNYGVPATPVQVANGAATFKIRINGGTSACAGPRNLNITLPTGYVYVSGSATVMAGSGSVAESSVLDNTATLAVSGIPASPDSTIISYQAYAGCDAIGGSSTTISYSLNGCAGTANATASVNAQNAQVNIISVTNSAYVGSVGDTYSRITTLTNDGYGGIDTVYFQVTNGSSLSTTGVIASDGTLTDMGGGLYRIVGAGGGTLNNDESFTITETVSILSCSGDMTSALKSYIAVSGTECNAVTSSFGAGAAVGGGGTPTIVLSVVEQPDLKCLPTDATTGWVTFQAKNTGTVDALIDLYSYNTAASPGAGGAAIPNPAHFPDNCASRSTYVDTAAGLTYSLDAGATWLPLSYSVAAYWSAAGYATDGEPLNLDFPGLTLATGDSIRYRFRIQENIPSCCIGDYYSSSYAITGNATDICGNNLVGYAYGVSAQQMGETRYSFVSNTSSPDAVDGEDYTLSYSGFIINHYASSRVDATAYVDFEFTLPAELVPSLSIADMALTKGTTVINPSSYTWNVATRKLRLHFLRSSISSLNYDPWTVTAKTTVSCLGSGVSSAVATLDIYTKFSTCWASEWQVACNQSIPVAMHGCNPGCTDGPNNLATIVRRTNYGIYSATNIPSDQYVSYAGVAMIYGVDGGYNPPVASSPSPNITSQNDTFSWEVRVANTAAFAKPNLFLAEANEINGVQIISVEALSGPGGTVTSTITESGSVYQLGNFASGESKYYKVNAYTTKCDNDTTHLLIGYNCYDYPVNNTAAATACKVDTLPLTVTLQKPSLQLSVLTQPVGTVDLCDLLTYEVEVTNSGLGEATMLSVRTRLPATGGIEYVPGSFGIKYPSTAGSYTSIADASVLTAGSNMIFNIPAATLASLPGTEKYRIQFQLKTTPCDFTSGEKVVFQPAGRNGCNNNILGSAVASDRINLNGVPPSVPSYTITSSADSIIACGSGPATVNYRFRIVNTGSVTTSAVDGYRITLPGPYTMDTSVSFTHNPSTSVYSESPASGVYDFFTGTGLLVGDSIVFTTTLTAPDMTALSCGVSDPIVEAGWVQFTATCSDPMITCNTKQLLEPENNTTSIVVQRPEYSLSTLDVDEPASAAGSNIIGTVDLIHDNTVYEPQDVTLSLYEDANTNGIYDAGEVLLGSQIFTVADLATQTLSFNIATGITSSTVISSVVAVGTFACACDTPSASVQNVPLPVHFYNEQAKVNDCSVQLSWSYESSGTLVTGFAVERQVKGGNWELIATVKESEHSYTDDAAIGAGQLLYRIKALNTGNEIAYSRSVSVTTSCKTIKVQVFPNPVSGRFYISVGGAVSGDTSYTITDKLGRVVLEGVVTDMAKTVVDVGMLSSGVYHVHVAYGGTSYTEQITIAE